MGNTVRKPFAVHFGILECWSVSYFRSVSWQWPSECIHPLGKALSRVLTPVETPSVTTPIIEKISFGGDLSILPPDKRVGYKGRLFRANSGHLIYSKIRVKQGSVCVVPPAVDWVAVSSEYPVYEVDSNIAESAYIELVLRSAAFQHYLDGLSHGGSTKTRIHPNQFETISIPIPPLPVQRKIVAYWDKAQAKISAAVREKKDLAGQAEGGLLSKIGITVPPVVPRKGVFFIQLSQNERWDTFFFRKDFVSLEKQIAAMPHIAVGNALHFINRGWKPSDFPTGKFEYIEISSVTKESGIISTKTVGVNNAPSRATTKVRSGDLMISTTRPYLGAFAMVDKSYNGCVCSSGFSVADCVKVDAITKDFILWFLKTSVGLRQMERRMTGGLYPAIVQSELEKILVPLPSLAVQNEIIEAHRRLNSTIERIDIETKKVGIDASRNIEHLIIGTLSVEEL